MNSDKKFKVQLNKDIKIHIDTAILEFSKGEVGEYWANSFMPESSMIVFRLTPSIKITVSVKDKNWDVFDQQEKCRYCYPIYCEDS